MTDVTNEMYNELMDKYNKAIEERNAFEEQCKKFTADIATKDEKIKNLNDALYNSIITRQKPDSAMKDDEPKSFDDLLREAFQSSGSNIQ